VTSKQFGFKTHLCCIGSFLVQYPRPSLIKNVDFARRSQKGSNGFCKSNYRFLRALLPVARHGAIQFQNAGLDIHFWHFWLSAADEFATASSTLEDGCTLRLGWIWEYGKLLAANFEKTSLTAKRWRAKVMPNKSWSPSLPLAIWRLIQRRWKCSMRKACARENFDNLLPIFMSLRQKLYKR